MIIRENNDTFFMIEQNHHAHISAEIINYWKDHFFKDDPYVHSVLHAIKNHDLGWDLFDQQPFWNDKKHQPYSFIDFPILPKIALYTHGVDLVEKQDPYAALLCSAHYMKFMKNQTYPEVNTYLKNEEIRQQRILTNFPTIAHNTFQRHLAILQFADNISLYFCLNEPGLKNSETHYFFKSGIPISEKISKNTSGSIKVNWLDENTISLNGLPYIKPFSILINQKKLTKQQIKRGGLIKTYQTAPYEKLRINFTISNNE